MNYYDLLEVSPRASPAVIRAAYKSLMQRYHPDKNPDDPQLARMATEVVHAFEVLSDEKRRQEYDRKLNAESGKRGSRAVSSNDKRPAQSAAKTSHVGIVLASAVVVVLSVWSLVSLRNLATPDERADASRPELATSSPARDIPKLVTGLSVVLAERDASENRNRVLFIPSLGVRVGPRDSQGAIRHIRNLTNEIEAKLNNDLSGASYAELIAPGGERYLAALVLAAVRRATSPPDSADPASFGTDPMDRYGAVEVVLPQSFSVR